MMLMMMLRMLISRVRPKGAQSGHSFNFKNQYLAVVVFNVIHCLAYFCLNISKPVCS